MIPGLCLQAHLRVADDIGDPVGSGRRRVKPVPVDRTPAFACGDLAWVLQVLVDPDAPERRTGGFIATTNEEFTRQRPEFPARITSEADGIEHARQAR